MAGNDLGCLVGGRSLTVIRGVGSAQVTWRGSCPPWVACLSAVRAHAPRGTQGAVSKLAALLATPNNDVRCVTPLFLGVGGGGRSAATYGGEEWHWRAFLHLDQRP